MIQTVVLTRTRPTFTAVLGVEAVADDTPYVLVDLSDTTNFPHTNTSEIHLLGLVVSAEKASDGVYDIWVGVVIENDGTDGSAEWVHCFHIEHIPNNATETTDRFQAVVDFTLGGANPEGVNLAVRSGATPRIVTNLSQANSANWKNNAGLASPVGVAGGDTGKPGAGDLVVWVEEVSGSGTIDFCVTAIYETA